MEKREIKDQEGIRQRVDKSEHKSREDRFEELIKRKLSQKEHLWTLITMFSVNPEDMEDWNLDRENLISVTPPGCYICEQPYSPGIAMMKCRGVV